MTHHRGHDHDPAAHRRHGHAVGTPCAAARVSAPARSLPRARSRQSSRRQRWPEQLDVASRAGAHPPRRTTPRPPRAARPTGGLPRPRPRRTRESPEPVPHTWYPSAPPGIPRDGPSGELRTAQWNEDRGPATGTSPPGPPRQVAADERRVRMRPMWTGGCLPSSRQRVRGPPSAQGPPGPWLLTPAPGVSAWHHTPRTATGGGDRHPQGAEAPASSAAAESGQKPDGPVGHKGRMAPADGAPRGESDAGRPAGLHPGR